MTNSNERMYQAIEKHGANLNKIFKTNLDNITLSKRVLSIERKAHELATDYCNGADGITTENFDIYADTILLRLDRLLGWHDKGVPVFLNGDCRGYALKIRSEYVQEHNLEIHKDWGGYGILAPDFSQEQ